MHDFGKLVYLDLQKTGSTFVSRFLRQTCILRELREWKHGPLNVRPKKGTYYFITVRHPVAQYSSLFRYGLDGRGGLYKRLLQVGRAELYNSGADAFSSWLRFVLDYRNAALLGEGFERVPEDYDLGFLSYRYLMLSLAMPERTLLAKPAGTDVLHYAREKSIVDHIVYNERLNEGLLELATKIKPEYFNQEKVAQFFLDIRRTNEARIKADEIGTISPELYSMVSRKERVLLNLYDEERRPPG
jgi:hypothetical protein